MYKHVLRTQNKDAYQPTRQWIAKLDLSKKMTKSMKKTSHKVFFLEDWFEIQRMTNSIKSSRRGKEDNINEQEILLHQSGHTIRYYSPLSKKRIQIISKKTHRDSNHASNRPHELNEVGKGHIRHDHTRENSDCHLNWKWTSVLAWGKIMKETHSNRLAHGINIYKMKHQQRNTQHLGKQKKSVIVGNKGDKRKECRSREYHESK